MDDEICDFDCAGTVITFDDKEVKVQEQLTEVHDDRMGQQHVLALAENTKTAESHMDTITETHPTRGENEDVAHLEEKCCKHQQINKALQRGLQEINSSIIQVGNGDLSTRMQINALEMNPEISTINAQSIQ
ncbi:hypothetical protein BDV36DRAFT_292695 [Aspergillus pseudocaelatus]|uniref:Uncharacterized protein n=1 Tax=Aspergillus pseudocaelatus TaxID=1825620 RepID=A0ABQ6WV87_9EURO|nr:hypothetical protein BDV36DRAFT_292695 [Aspergillus pseudocaelatus]